MDSSGHWLETAIDGIFFIDSLNEAVEDPSPTNVGFAVWDGVALIAPAIPGTYVYKGGKKVVKVVKKKVLKETTQEVGEKVVKKSVKTGVKKTTNKATKSLLKRSKYIKSIKISDKKMYQLGTHFKKHGRKMGYSSKKEYEKAARNFFKKYKNKATIFEGTFNSAHGANNGMRQIIVRYEGKQLIISKETGQLIDFYEGIILDSFINLERIQ